MFVRRMCINPSILYATTARALYPSTRTLSTLKILRGERSSDTRNVAIG